MKILKILSLVFICLLAFCAISESATYTVSPTGSGANYSATSFNALTGTSHAGDVFNFVGTFTQSYKISVNMSGTSSATVVLDGTNASFAPTAVYFGGGLITVDSQSYILIRNFNFHGLVTTGSSASQGGIFIKATTGSVANHITVDNCEFSNTTNGMLAQGDVNYGTVTNCYFHDLCGSACWVTNYNTYRPDYWIFGGSPGNGNTFVDVGYYDGTYDVDAFFYTSQITNVIISYNLGYATKNGWGLSGIYGNEDQKILVEYNIFHSLNAVNHRSPVTFKGDELATRDEGPFIVRFNHFWDVYGDRECWGDTRGLVHISNNFHDVYVYGNYLHDTSVGVYLSNGYGSTYNDDISTGPCYVFSNVIFITTQAGVRIGGMTSPNYDSSDTVYVFNNTFYKTTSLDATLGEGYGTTGDDLAYQDDAAITDWLTGAQINNHHYFNNIVHTPRPGVGDYRVLMLRSEATHSSNDYQLYYDASGSANVAYWDDSDNSYPFHLTNYLWSSGSRPFYGGHDAFANPHFSAPASGDFRLTDTSTAAIGTGYTVGTGNIATVNICGTDYAIPWSFAIGPNAVFPTANPDGITVDARSRGTSGWDKGAYIYTGSAPPDPGTPSSTGINGVTAGYINGVGATVN
jgi:hypothetical protein